MKIPDLLYDPEDAALIASHFWSLDGHGYAQTAVRRSDGRWTTERLHRLILGAQPGQHVDHINHNKLDNRRQNLRIVTNGQNQQNRRGPTRSSTTGVRGVFWHKGARKYRAQLQVNHQWIYLGLFKTLAEAEAAVIAARRRFMTHSSECSSSTHPPPPST